MPVILIVVVRIVLSLCKVKLFSARNLIRLKLGAHVSECGVERAPCLDSGCAK